MDKNILEQYIDACKLIKETDDDIRELEKSKRTVQDSVRGSNPEFPYQPQSFHIEGTKEEAEDKRRIEEKRKILKERKANAERVKLQVEEWMNTIPMRMQRIIRFKFFKKMSWDQAAGEIGGNATGESIKKEFQRFLKINKICPECPTCPELK